MDGRTGAAGNAGDRGRRAAVDGADAGTAADRGAAAGARRTGRPADAGGVHPRPRPGQRGGRPGGGLPHRRREHVAVSRPSRPRPHGRPRGGVLCAGVAGADGPRPANHLGAGHAAGRGVAGAAAHAQADGRRPGRDGPRAVRARRVGPHARRRRPARRPAHADASRGADAARPDADADADAGPGAHARAAGSGRAAAAQDGTGPRDGRRLRLLPADRRQHRHGRRLGRGAGRFAAGRPRIVVAHGERPQGEPRQLEGRTAGARRDGDARLRRAGQAAGRAGERRPGHGRRRPARDRVVEGARGRAEDERVGQRPGQRPPQPAREVSNHHFQRRRGPTHQRGSAGAAAGRRAGVRRPERQRPGGR